jgi:hypothetical protein
MTTLDFDFSARPVLFVRDRLFVLLDDVRPALGVQHLLAADMSSLLSPTDAILREEYTVPVWYDGSGVCYVRRRGLEPRRLPVTDLPLWIGVNAQGEFGQRLTSS